LLPPPLACGLISTVHDEIIAIDPGASGGIG
jgi:hypothetical protein